MPQHDKASRLRRRLLDEVKRLFSLVDSLIAERGPMVRGTFQAHGTRCGKPNCKCVEGELHSTAVLAVNEEGKRRNIYVPIPDRLDLKRRSERYRSVRKRRADLAKLGAKLLGLVDQLLEALIDPYSPKQTRKAQARTKTRRKRTQ